MAAVGVDSRSVQAAAFLEWAFGDGRKEFLDILLRRNKGPNIVPVPKWSSPLHLTLCKCGCSTSIEKLRPV
jgi:hypothetical protein